MIEMVLNGIDESGAVGHMPRSCRGFKYYLLIVSYL